MAETTSSEIFSRLLQAKSVLLLAHERPDGDALGSLFGMQSFLRCRGVKADVFLMAEPPYRYQNILGDYLLPADGKRAADYGVTISLDCANCERLAYCESVEALRNLTFFNLDHHLHNSIPAQLSCVEATASSTCEILARTALEFAPDLEAQSANFFLMGMMTDTGSFRFSNTRGDVLRVAAKLLDCGADLEKIVNALFFSNPLKQLKLEAELVTEKLKLACNDRFAYAYIDDALLQKYDFDLREDEGLIDILRGIDTAVIAMLVSRKGNAFKLSMRSKNAKCPVIGIARKFSGGGHALAAGATLQAANFAEVEKIILPEIETLLGKL